MRRAGSTAPGPLVEATGRNAARLRASALAWNHAERLHVDPGGERQQSAIVREWASQVPGVVHLPMATPYPDTELFHAESRQLAITDSKKDCLK